jgi:ribosomal protein S18 acetylase RimI-like enzyme
VWPRAEEGELKDKTSLYVIILSVMPQYRRYGIATQLVQEVLRIAEEKKSELYSVYLHTPINNSSAIEFYEKNGFEKKETVPDYYKSLGPEHSPEGVVLEKVF